MNKKLIRFDWAMKKLLRHKANFEILEGLLSELLRFDVRIENILESEANKEDEYDKYNRVDILVKSQNGELMLVEVQNDSEVDYFQRMLFGVSKLVTEYIQQGEPYGKIKKIYSVNIVYFGLGQGKDYVYEYQGEFVGMHENDILQPTVLQKRDYSIEKIADIFPKYYLLKVNNFTKVAEDTLDEWVYFLKTSEVGDGFKAKGLDKAKEKMKYEQLSDSDKKSYDRFQENRLIERSVEYTREEEAKLRELEVKQREEEAKQREEEAKQREEDLVQRIKQREEEAKQREEDLVQLIKQREEDAKQREEDLVQRIKQREEETKQREEEAKQRDEEAKQRDEDAKQREENLIRQANQREEEAKQREEEAKLRDEEAKQRDGDAKQREEDLIRQAKQREEEAKLREEDAKQREENLIRQIKQREEDLALQAKQREDEATLVGIKAGKLASAKTAIVAGLPNELIAQITGLAIDEIQQLRTE